MAKLPSDIPLFTCLWLRHRAMWSHPRFILSYQVFLFVWLNFQLDKSEFGEHEREVIPTQTPPPSSNSLIGVRQIDTETGKFSSLFLPDICTNMYITCIFCARIFGHSAWAVGVISNHRHDNAPSRLLNIIEKCCEIEGSGWVNVHETRDFALSLADAGEFLFFLWSTHLMCAVCANSLLVI